MCQTGSGLHMCDYAEPMLHGIWRSVWKAKTVIAQVTCRSTLEYPLEMMGAGSITSRGYSEVELHVAKQATISSSALVWPLCKQCFIISIIT